ncbi:MAG: choice-of-anchor D domain-containing protein [Wenzhouxiangella sp.]|nr:MAG: choice-of-anchor D domain-containing protein [Wenzhouxiangella sp.]
MPSGQFGIVTFQISDSAQPDDVISLTIVGESYSDQDGNVVPPAGNSQNGSITVVDVTAILRVSPTELQFGNTFTGSTSSFEEITIENEGSDGVMLQVTSISLTGPFSLAGGGSCGAVPFSLEDSESCTQRVVFAPIADGPASGSLTVHSDADEVINATVDLSGEGIPPPVELVFGQSPDYGVAGGPLYAGVVVHVLDTNGDLFTSDNTTVVTMSFANDPSGVATLSGTTAVSVSNGVAIFSDLSIDQVGNGFELRASDQGGTLSSGDSDDFAVLPLDLFQDRFEQPD